MIFFFALLCSQHFAIAEQKRDGFVEDMFQDKQSNGEQEEKAEEEQVEQPLFEDEVPNVVEENKVGVTIGDFIKMFIALIFVIALLYLTLKIINNRSRSYRSSQLIENLGGTSLGANRSVQLVKVGNRILIVGVGENIQLLTEIKDEEELQSIIESYNERIDQLVQPSGVVSKLFKNITNKGEPKKEVTEFETMLKNEFKQISNERKNLYREIEKKGTNE